MKKVKFYDENTRRWWMPDTGGVNIPALNDLLDVLGMAFSDKVYEGDFKIGDHDMYYASGSSIVKFPEDGILLTQNLKDQGYEVLKGESVAVENIPILGLHQSTPAGSGRVVLYGDSNCLDSSHLQKDCFWLLSAMLEYTAFNTLPSILTSQEKTKLDPVQELPQRMEGNHLYRYSKVIESQQGKTVTRQLPACPHLAWATHHPLNVSSDKNLYQPQKLLSIDIGETQLGGRHGSDDANNIPLPQIQDKSSFIFDPGTITSNHSQELDTGTVFPALAFLSTALVCLFLFNQYYKGRSKPKRRRPRMKKLHQILYGKGPGV
ncbi:hypothetical protein ScPMuIL_001900 [Solemya velum]